MTFSRRILLLICVTLVKSEDLLLDFLSFNESEVKLSEFCEIETRKLGNAIKNEEIWALKVNDASGRKSKEFFMGNNYLLGSEIGCEKLNDTPEIILIKDDSRIMNLKTTKIKSEVAVKYQVIYLKHSSPLQFNANIFNRSILHISLCIPKSCNSNDIEILGRQLIKTSFNNTESYGNVEFVGSKILNLRSNFTSDIFVVISM